MPDEVVDGDEGPDIDISVTLLFGEPDDRVLAALPLVANGRALQNIPADEIAVFANVLTAQAARTLEIVQRARLFEDGELHMEVQRYLAAAALKKMKAPSKRRR